MVSACPYQQADKGTPKQTRKARPFVDQLELLSDGLNAVTVQTADVEAEAGCYSLVAFWRVLVTLWWAAAFGLFWLDWGTL